MNVVEWGLAGVRVILSNRVVVYLFEVVSSTAIWFLPLIKRLSARLLKVLFVLWFFLLLSWVLFWIGTGWSHSEKSISKPLYFVYHPEGRHPPVAFTRLFAPPWKSFQGRLPYECDQMSKMSKMSNSVCEQSEFQPLQDDMDGVPPNFDQTHPVDFKIRLTLPRMPQNTDQGLFMVHFYLCDAKGHNIAHTVRTAVIPYQAPILWWIRSLALAVPTLLGLYTDDFTYELVVMEGLTLSSTRFASVRVEIESVEKRLGPIIVNHGAVHADVQLSGFWWFLHHWYKTTALFVVFLLFSGQTVLWIVWLAASWLLGGSRTKERKEREELERFIRESRLEAARERRVRGDNTQEHGDNTQENDVFAMVADRRDVQVPEVEPDTGIPMPELDSIFKDGKNTRD